MTTVTTQNQLAHDLSVALRQTFTLYQRTHLAHWNVKGPHFPQLHAMFDAQYNELWAALDTLAERVRATGADVPADVLSAGPVDLPRDALEMVRVLAADHRALSVTLRALEATATESGDPATADLAIERVRAHEQAAWMMEATCDGR